MNRMHSFSFRSVGNLARNPESIAVLPGKCFTRFCLISNDFVVEDPVCQCCVTSAWFVAVGDLGDELVIKARKGDQLIVEGVVLTDAVRGITLNRGNRASRTSHLAIAMSPFSESLPVDYLPESVPVDFQ